MQSRPSGANDQSESHDATIPGFARAWESYPQVASSVRRPSPLPDPHSYHERIDTDAIFELDEKQKGGRINTILVVPFGCKYCRVLKQACSRARPACARCRNAGVPCESLGEGYQRLPGPKMVKNGGARKQLDKRVAADVPSHGARAASLSPTPSVATSASKRPLSPAFDPVPPRKKREVQATARKRKARRSEGAPPEEMDVEVAASTEKPSAPKWTFVYSPQGQEREHSTPCNDDTLTPRVWTNSVGALFTIFPELAKSAIGFSWFQSDTPILLLDTNYARGHWINSTTLHVELLWDFSCYEYELEPDPQTDVEDSARPCSSQADTSNNVEREAKKMDPPTLYSAPGTGSLPTYVTVSAPIPTSHTPMLSRDDISVDACQDNGDCTGGGCLNPVSGVPLTQPFPPSPSSLSPPPPDSLPNFGRIPLDKPPEVETFLDSHLRFIPLLLWMPHDSGLIPRNLSPEYAYSCLGLFFVSDLRNAVVRYDVSSTPGRVHGRVCWSVTLEWAPGGEDALFDSDSTLSSNTISEPTQVDTTRDLLHPWWFDPTDTSSRTEEADSYRPRDLRLQFFSFIPLDLLAEFHPSESFPRGWFCKSCGLINLQLFFRHRICQSSKCTLMRDKRIPRGKIDALSSLRDPYQCIALIRPTNGIPTAVVSECVTWDDGMQSWVYDVKTGVSLCHVFTGNQGHLQEDATALLEKIQCEVLLRQEDYGSPYFVHRTKLSHPSDGSEATVPVGTPHCVRTAYYTLCDFVRLYGERDEPRFGELRIQAWATTGSKKGNMFRASKSPVVVHCLGADVVLNMTPKGGYHDGGAKSIALDKGKGRAMDDDREGSPSTVSRAGYPHDPQQVGDDRASSMPGLEVNEAQEHATGDDREGSPPTVPRTEHPYRPQQVDDDRTPFMPVVGIDKPLTVAESVDERITAMDTGPQCSKQVDGGIATSDSNTGPEIGVTSHGVAERRARKQHKGTKDKNKASVPEICMTLVHGDCVVLFGDDFECQIVRTGTTILVMGFPEET